MTLTIGGIPGSGGSYYTGSSYYKEGEVKAQWGGGAIDALGLKGRPVTTEQIDKLFEGQVPDGNRVAKFINGKWVSDPGRDLTFSADKSVSLLAQGPHREAILASMVRSADKAMKYAESEFAATRITNSETGKREIIGDQKLVYALFLEETSRADDPGLHVHVPTPGLAMGQDGKFKALWNEEIYNNQILLGQIFRAELAKDLKGIGFQIEKTGQNGQFKVKGLDPAVRETFSKRRTAMVKKAGVDFKDPKKMSRINQLTRPNKSNKSREALLPMWIAELKALGTSTKEITSKALAEDKVQPQNLRSVITSTVKDKAETQRSFGKYELLRAVMSETYGNFTIDQIQSELDYQKDKGFIAQSKDGKHYALARTLSREKRLISHMEAGHLQTKPLLHKQSAMKALSGRSLTSGQINGAVLTLSSHDRFIGLQGTAGAGKTTMLKTALPFFKARGFQLVGIAPTHKAVDELTKTGQFDKTMTVQQYLLTPRGGPKTVLVVDESSMLGTDQMLGVLTYANRKKLGKVILMGDTNQMGSVSAGTPFRDMQEAGLRTAYINKVVRQTDKRHRGAIEQLSLGNIREGFIRLDPEFHETEKDKLESKAAAQWIALNDSKAPIIVQTNRQKDAINAAIKATQNQDPKNVNIRHAVLKPHHLTQEKKKFVSSYAGATHLKFNRQYKGLGIRKGDILKIKSLNEGRAHILLEKGSKTLKFHPAKHALGKDSTQAFREQAIPLGKGDRIRFTQSLKPKNIKNNDLGIIKSVKNGRIAIGLDKGKDMTLDASSQAARFLDHAWAHTAHAYQGTTVDHAIVVMPSKRGPLTTLDSLYTGASRHRISVSIITDNKSRLQQNLQRALATKENESKLFRDDKPSKKQVSAISEFKTERVLQRDKNRGISQKINKPRTRRTPVRGDFGR